VFGGWADNLDLKNDVLKIQLLSVVQIATVFFSKAALEGFHLASRATHSSNEAP
jgi:hypothetical protein